MKILHLVSYYKPAWKLGGPVHSVSKLCEGLSKLNTQVEVFTSSVAGRSECLDVVTGIPSDVDGVKVTYLPTWGHWRFFLAPSLISLLRNRIHEFDIVHVTGSFTFFQLAWALETLRTAKPFVVSPRGSFMKNAMKRGILKSLKKAVFARTIESFVVKRCSAVHCVTEMERKAVKKYFPETSTFVIYNGLDLSEFSDLPPRGGLRRRLGLEFNSFVFLYLGRLHPHKGLDLTIKAFSRILQTGIEADLVVAGDAEVGSNNDWRNLAGAQGALKHTHFIGYAKGLAKQMCFSDADAMVLNSYSENFGISVAEALVCGLPVLISDQSGISDWVLQHRAGVIVPQDVARIAEAMALMIRNRQTFRALAEKARVKARADFDYREVSRRMLSQYESILYKSDSSASEPHANSTVSSQRLCS